MGKPEANKQLNPNGAGESDKEPALQKRRRLLERGVNS